MILAIDVGNTKIKVAVFELDTMILREDFTNENLLDGLKKILKNFSKCNKTIVSSVSNVSEEVLSLLKSKNKIYFLTQESEFPFQNKYATPLTLGMDRKVIVSGAVLKFPNQNCLIIDAGSCITYDFVDANKNYFGGAISPGIEMRYKALNNYTAKLPKLDTKEPESFVGNSTNESIHSGVVNGVVYEIEGFISDYLRENKYLTIILTGGDTLFLAKRLKNPIFANSNFLLESLNLLHQYNIQ